MNTAKALRSRFLLSPQVASARHSAAQIYQPAAVLIPLIERQQELFVLLTRRSLHLRHHAGQICFPGGKYDAEDGSLRQTALRETQEELGIASHDIQVWGHLPEYHTVSGFIITPFVATLVPDYRLQLTREEVAEAFELSLQPLLERRNYGHWPLIRGGQTQMVVGCSLQQHLIWGATARILYDLAGQLAD